MVDTFLASGGIHPDWVYEGNGLTTVTNPDAAGDDNTATYIQWSKDPGVAGIAGAGGGETNFVGILLEDRPLADADIDSIVVRAKISYSTGRSVANRAGSQVSMGISDLAGTFDFYSEDMPLVADGTTDTFTAAFDLAALQENDPGLTWADFNAAAAAGLYFRVWFKHVDVEAQAAPVTETIRIREASFTTNLTPSTWPIVEDFEGGVTGTVADSTNTAITGIHYFENYGDSEVVFTDEKALSGTLSVTAQNTYEHIQVPFDGSAITDDPEDFYFWYRFEAEAPYTGGGPVFHQLYGGALGFNRVEDYNIYPSTGTVSAKDATTNTWLIQFEDSHIEPTNTEFSFDIPKDLWVKVRVQVTALGHITYTLTGEDEIEYGVASSVVPDLMQTYTPPQYFAFHMIWVEKYAPGSGYGQSWLDSINHTPAAVPEEPEPMFHFTRSIRSNAGTLRLGSAVVIRAVGTLDEVTVPLYSDVDGLVPLDPTFTATEGVVDFYVDEPMIVDIAVTPVGGSEVVLPNVWVGKTLSAGDVENPTTVAEHTHTPAEAGAAPAVHTHTAAEVGASDAAHTHTAVQVGAIPADDVDEIVTLTQAEYDAIVTPDPDILYVIREVV